MEGEIERTRELGGVHENCRGKTHGTVMGIALQPAITTAVEAAVHSGGRGKVTVSATLKKNPKKRSARARPQNSQGENAARPRR